MGLFLLSRISLGRCYLKAAVKSGGLGKIHKGGMTR